MATANEKIEVVAALRRFVEGTPDVVITTLAEYIGVTSDLGSYIRGNNLPTSANCHLISKFADLSFAEQQNCYYSFVVSRKNVKKDLAQQVQELLERFEKLEHRLLVAEKQLAPAGNVHAIFATETETFAKAAGL